MKIEGLAAQGSAKPDLTRPGPATPGPATPGPATPGPATPGPATPWPALLLGLLLATTAGCKSSHKPAPRILASASASPTASIETNALTPGRERLYHPKPPPTAIPMPSGPRLAILQGQGVGPIRIGATVKTIERHMAAPCDLLDEKRCRYIARAVDFYLTDGKVERIVVHRADRPAGKDKTGKERRFGIFNGAIPPDFQPMMHKRVIVEHLGPPLKTEAVKEQPEFHTEERAYYDGMAVEYDRLENGNLVLGAVIITKPSGPSSQPM